MLSKYGTVYFEWDVKESVDDIKGNEKQKEALEDFFNALGNYTDYVKQLEKTNFGLNLTMLLYGPPGTGKTSLSMAYSKKKKIPICVVDSDRLVSSLLGDTIKNIRQVVELSANIAKNNGAFILFFDEIDAIGSERSNVHEVGEIKRAVISFLQAIDKVTYEGVPLAIFGATNHQHQLDSAIWRRFTFHLEFDFPNFELRKKIIKSFMDRIKNGGIEVEKSISEKLIEEFNKINSFTIDLKNKSGRSKSELEDDYIKEEIEKKGEPEGILTLSRGYSGSDIERGTRVALFKALGNSEPLKYDTLKDSLKLVGGTKIHVERQDVLSSSSQIPDSTKDINLDIVIANYEELVNKLPEMTRLFKDISRIIKNNTNLKTDYFRGNKELTEFINIFKEICMLIKQF